MKEFTFHLMELNHLRQILDPDIDDNGNADFDNRLAGAIDYFMPILLAIKAEAQSKSTPPAAVNQQLLEALQPLRFDVWADHYEEDRLWYEPREDGSLLYYDQVKAAIAAAQSKEVGNEMSKL